MGSIPIINYRKASWRNSILTFWLVVVFNLPGQPGFLQAAQRPVFQEKFLQQDLKALNTPDSRHGDEPKGQWNLKTKTLGGQQFWTDVRHVSGWRVQQNAVTSHFRLIDDRDYRHAWGNFAHCQEELNQRIADGSVKPNQGKVVILLHGLIRTHRSMATLAKFIDDNSQYQTILFEYASSRKLVADHAQALRSVIDQLGPDVTEINFVGHSLGNIVLRHYLQATTDPKSGLQGDQRIRRTVMIGPPNQGSRMARLLKASLLFKAIGGASGAQLSIGWEQLEAELATPKHEFGIISGGQADDQRISNFVLSGKDDFTVSVDETKLVGAKDHLIRPLLHGTMMNQPIVMESTLRFLQNGYFISEQEMHPINSLKETETEPTKKDPA